MRNLLEIFMSLSLRRKASCFRAEKYYRIPSRTDLPSDKLPSWLNAAYYKALDIDWELVADKETEWMRKWDADIKSNK